MEWCCSATTPSLSGARPDPGEKVTVEIAKQSHNATADGTGKWRVTLKPLSVGEPLTMTIRGSSESPITFKDVLVGDVWLCSGQSNMAFRLSTSATGKEAIDAAKIPTLRVIQMPPVESAVPLNDCKAEWHVSSPTSVPDFSAVAFFFGRKLNQDLKVPIGLIQSTWGGTRIEAWTSRGAMEANPKLKVVFDREREMSAAAPADKEKFEAALAKWQVDAKAAEGKKEAAPKKPIAGASLQYRNYPARLYNGMIAPLVPFTIKGVIWYQGEANVVRAYEYRDLMPTMIQDWRTAWGNPTLPFAFVQLPGFGKVQTDPNEPAARAELREAQLLTLQNVPHTGMAVTMDVGEADNNHPTRKQEVGERLARWAMATVYGHKDVVYSGPVYKSMKVEGDKIRLTFDPVAESLRPADSAELRGFTIAGDDKKFAFATARIEGNDIVVSSPNVSRPVAVRYAWAFTPVCNLVNGEGLPASPFRTDDWQLTTFAKQ
jgi:sialate O-acetylesterase